MNSSERMDGESLVDYSTRLASIHQQTYCHESRREIGQFFTTASIARFMAGMLRMPDKKIRLLDPGAGTGVLSAAVCEEILRGSRSMTVEIDAYETDANVIPMLELVLTECKTLLELAGHTMVFNVIPSDFIQTNRSQMKEAGATLLDQPMRLYDFAISNPPYYKLSRDSPQAKAMPELVAGQPNIYPFFMALTSRMLRPGGEMVFITPRSFCSGLYYKSFRRWLLDKTKIVNIHIFESRSDIFDGEEVLQENVITKIRREKPVHPWDISISVSEGKDLRDPTKMIASSEDVIYRQNGDIFIRIPTSEDDLEVIHIMDAWPNTLRGLGYEISTGPVVDFRTDYLVQTYDSLTDQVPLLWAHNLRDGEVVWPNGGKKPQAIEDREGTKAILLPVQNYVLLKRFSSKEQKRRIEAAVMVEEKFDFKKIGLENHLNYIHKPGGKLSKEEAYGLAGLLNTTLLDNYFRSLNGHTQVNATEMRCLPFPNAEHLAEIGRQIISAKEEGSCLSVDAVSSEVLGIDECLIQRISGCSDGEDRGGRNHSKNLGIAQGAGKRKRRPNSLSSG